VTLEPPANRKSCPDILQVSPPALATSHLRIAAPRGARSIAIVVPNVPGDRDLPVFSNQLALR
jgi:hypothetical protein